MTTIGLGIQPVAGTCFIIPVSEHKEKEGGIYLPETVRSLLSYTGMVVAETPRPADPRGFVGRKVLVHSGIGTDFEWLGETYRKVPLNFNAILAVLYQGKWLSFIDGTKTRVTTPTENVKRCRHCKSRGEANILMNWDVPTGQWICPTCHRTERGQKMQLEAGKKQKLKRDVKVSADESEMYGEVKKVVRGTIYSYKGQKHRS